MRMTLRRFSSVKNFFGDNVRIYSRGDSNVTSGAAAALLQNDTAMISVANRVIAVGYITLSLPCGEQKQVSKLPPRCILTGITFCWLGAHCANESLDMGLRT